MSKIFSSFLLFFLTLTFLNATNFPLFAAAPSARLKYEIVFSDSVHPDPITGRVYIILAKDNKREPRLQVGGWRKSASFFGKDVENLRAGESAVIDEHVLGFPLNSLGDLPSGKYYIQALMNIYTQFHRADGHVIWAHNDQWEGQQFNRSPGNLYSKVDSLYLNPESGYIIRIHLDRVIPPIKNPTDTPFVKRIKIKSKILSNFWGQPIFLGAIILLPKDYVSYPDVQYPVLYRQGHFSRKLFSDFKAEDKFYQTWISQNFPRMIIAHLLHPCPYYDDSYAVNSQNCGPYGDAIMTELIPYIEEQFRIIKKPYARILYGGSTGGWISLALQVFHPDFFGGTWSIAPDPVDFTYFQLINIYKDDNAYSTSIEWSKPERPVMRNTHGQVIMTVRQFCQLEKVLGSKGRSGQQLDAFQAVFGPVGEDGYPKPLWDKETGKIDHEVAQYYKENFDLRYYLEKNWSWLGPKLVGKLHFTCGDMDNYYLNEALYELESFLENTKEPYYAGSFTWGRQRKRHGWSPWERDSSEFYKMVAKYITEVAPESEDTLKWKY
jgi:hypothetical protein